MSLQILLSGASGAVGRVIGELIETENHFLIAGKASRQHFFEPDVEADVIIDFSHPELLTRVIPFAVRRRLPLVTGTTGLNRRLERNLEEAAEHIPVCHAANFSLGVNLLVRLAGQAARALGQGFEIEILETHHRRKLDAPSGTAKWLGEVVSKARGLDFEASAVHDRSNRRQPRERGEIGYQAIRGGDVAGEHTVFFLADGERLELTHRSTDRQVFARGALEAASRITERKAGMVDFADLVLGTG
jgi:4-hydroxy-tetrahydrodipicolinate reductase